MLFTGKTYISLKVLRKNHARILLDNYTQLSDKSNSRGHSSDWITDIGFLIVGQ